MMVTETPPGRLLHLENEQLRQAYGLASDLNSPQLLAINRTLRR